MAPSLRSILLLLPPPILLSMSLTYARKHTPSLYQTLNSDPLAIVFSTPEITSIIYVTCSCTLTFCFLIFFLFPRAHAIEQPPTPLIKRNSNTEGAQNRKSSDADAIASNSNSLPPLPPPPPSTPSSRRINLSSSSSSSSTPYATSLYPLKEIATSKTDKDRFLCLFPLLKSELLNHMKSQGMPAEAVTWVDSMVEYNVKGGKLNRGVTVIAVQKSLFRAGFGPIDSTAQSQPSEVSRASSEGDGGSLLDTSASFGTPKAQRLPTLSIARAAVLGWSIEYLQSFFLVADDIMDASPTRRGAPCWYKVKGVGMIGINDSFLLESFVFSILKTHFGSEVYYTELVELFLSIVQRTEFGQLLDLTSQPSTAPVDLQRFTLERYRLIVRYKTAYYTFYLPIAIGMLTSGVTEPAAFKIAENICCEMGEYFQVQDDYLDCYGDAAVLGKVGTDIQDNKCSWLIVQALKRGDKKQLEKLETNYGKWDDKCVQKVKKIYVEVGMKEVFEEYEKSSYERILKEIEQVEKFMPREVFVLLLDKIYKRKK